MAVLCYFFSRFTLVILLSFPVISNQQQPEPVLDPAEQEAVYRVLESINPDISWRSLFPDDLCYSAPHGVACDFFYETNDTAETVHITELSLGNVSDYTPNPPCTANSTLDPLLFTSFKYLRKLFFYKCFTDLRVSVPDVPASFGSNLEELVFVENPSLVAPLDAILRRGFTSLRRLVLTGNRFYGGFSDSIEELVNLEEITLSRNQLRGNVSVNFSRLKKLKILDLSGNALNGNLPGSMGDLTDLLKLDLGSNGFSGKIPESLKQLKSLEFLDLSFNHFGNHGIPLFLAEMPRLKEVYLSGTPLGGPVPAIWENLGDLLGLGFSGMGLVGKIPPSMGVFLKKLHYLGLDDNKLEGTVPQELGFLESVNEINLENNNLSGRLPSFANGFGKKLKLGGNPGLCVDQSLAVGEEDSGSFGRQKLCKRTEIPSAIVLSGVPRPPLLVQPQVLMLLGFCLFLLQITVI